MTVAFGLRTHGFFVPDEFAIEVAEERGLDILPELEGGFVAAEGDGPDSVSDGHGPAPVKPWPSDHEVGVLRIVLLRVTEYLPGAPGIFLIPETGNV